MKTEERNCNFLGKKFLLQKVQKLEFKQDLKNQQVLLFSFYIKDDKSYGFGSIDNFGQKIHDLNNFLCCYMYIVCIDIL